MIVYENSKIIAVGKKLLNELKISLEEVSSIITKLQLETAVLNQNSIEIYIKILWSLPIMIEKNLKSTSLRVVTKKLL
jgi:hypothetical protein